MTSAVVIRVPILSALLLGTIAACSTAGPPVDPSANAVVAADEPLTVLAGDVGPGEVRRDLIATAAERFGQAALEQALAAPTHLIVKRFAGMLPPPPPGEPAPEYVPPAALLMRGAGGWMIASESGWRRLGTEPSAEIDAVIADPAFWSEEALGMPCPDYGASLLLLKVEGRPATVRKSMCPSSASKIVSAALRG